MTLGQLKELIYARLSSLTTLPIYDGKQPENTPLPHVVYTIASSSFSYGRTDSIIEVEYWSNINDDTLVLAESDKIKQGFNYAWGSETYGMYMSYIEFEGEIPDPNINITRLSQRYFVKYR